MATGTLAANPPARVIHWNAIQYIKKTVNYNDAGIASGIPMSASIPAGAQIVGCLVNILTVFNAGTTNVLTVGQNASNYNDIVGASDVNEAATGATLVQTGSALDITSDVVPYVKYAQTGTAATTGKARVVLMFTCPGD